MPTSYQLLRHCTTPALLQRGAFGEIFCEERVLLLALENLSLRTQAIYVADFQLKCRLKITYSHGSMKQGVLILHVSPWVVRESITGFLLYNEHRRTVFSLSERCNTHQRKSGFLTRQELTTKLRIVSWRFRTSTRFIWDTKMANIKVGNKQKKYVGSQRSRAVRALSGGTEFTSCFNQLDLFLVVQSSTHQSRL